MNVATVNESIVNEFESQQGWVYGRIWRQEMKGRNDANINSELKLKKKSHVKWEKEISFLITTH